MNSGKYSPFEPLATYRLQNTKRSTIRRPQSHESTNPVSEKPGTVHAAGRGARSVLTVSPDHCADTITFDQKVQFWMLYRDVGCRVGNTPSRDARLPSSCHTCPCVPLR